MRRSDSWLFGGGGDLIFWTVTTITTSYNRQGGSSKSVTRQHNRWSIGTHEFITEKADYADQKSRVPVEIEAKDAQ